MKKTFHADEVFATIILSKVLKKVSVARVSSVDIKNVNEGTIIYDIGGGKFDHHQLGGNGQRPNGVKYASCGLIWMEYGKQLLKKYNLENEKIDELWNQIDKNLIQYIDANDNGQVPNIDTGYKFIHLARIIGEFNPSWNSNEDPDECFIEAIKVANIIFEKIIDKEIAKFEAKELVNNAIEETQDGIMILKQFLPWKEILLTSDNPRAKEINFVVFPSNRGGFNAYTVPIEMGSFESKKKFPKEWGGLKGDNLQNVTGVKTARFCHNACFMCVADTKEDAVRLAEIANKN